MSQPPRPIHVVAAALIDAQGRVLIAKRPPGSHLAGGWEFPGGKLELGERSLDGLAREVREELGVQLGKGPHRPLRKVRHSYSDRHVFIEAWMVTDYSGEPRGLDGQEIRWGFPSELASVPLLAADSPIIDALRLPDRLIVESAGEYTIDIRSAGKLSGFRCMDLAEALAAEEGGADFIVMRTRASAGELSLLCKTLTIPVFALGITLEAAWDSGATGVNQITM